MLRRRLTLLERAGHFEDCGGRKSVGVCLGSMELICSKCGSDATPLPCIFDSLFSRPALQRIKSPLRISTKALPQTFQFSSPTTPGSTPEGA
jgi:hypothetical protein